MARIRRGFGIALPGLLLPALLLAAAAAAMAASGSPRDQPCPGGAPSPPSCWALPPLPRHRAPRVKDAAAPAVVYFTDGTDAGDTLTLVMLIKSPRFRLAAIYTAGNGWTNPGASARSFYDLLYMHGVTDVPVYIGSHVALAEERRATGTGSPPKRRYRDILPAGPAGILYADTLWGTAHLLPTSYRAYSVLAGLDTDERSIPALLAQLTALPAGTPVALLCTGTLTAVAKLFSAPYAAALAPLLPRITGLTVTGGAVGVAGNLYTLPSNPVAEFNMYLDARSAGEGLVAATAAGVAVTLVPLDATTEAPFTPALLATLRNRPATPEAQYMGVLLELLRRTWTDPAGFYSTAYLWDTTAALLVAYPALVTGVVPTHVRVVDGPPRGSWTGWTPACTDAEVAGGTSGCFPVRMVSGVDGPAVAERMLVLLQAPANSAVRRLQCWEELPGGPLATNSSAVGG